MNGLSFSTELSNFLIRLLEQSPQRTIYNYAQAETPTLANWLRVIAAAAKPLNTMPVPSEVLQQHTELPWEEWSYAPFSYCPLLMSLSRAEVDVGLDFRTPLREWVQSTVDAYLDDPGALAVAKHAKERPAEIEFAARFSAAKYVL